MYQASKKLQLKVWDTHVSSKQARHAPPQGLDAHVSSKQTMHLLEVWTVCLKHKAHHLEVWTTCIKQATSAHQGLEFEPHVSSMKCTRGNQQKCVFVCVCVCVRVFFFHFPLHFSLFFLLTFTDWYKDPTHKIE